MSSSICLSFLRAARSRFCSASVDGEKRSAGPDGPGVVGRDEARGEAPAPILAAFNSGSSPSAELSESELLELLEGLATGLGGGSTGSEGFGGGRFPPPWLDARFLQVWRDLLGPMTTAACGMMHLHTHYTQ